MDIAIAYIPAFAARTWLAQQKSKQPTQLKYATQYIFLQTIYWITRPIFQCCGDGREDTINC